MLAIPPRHRTLIVLLATALLLGACKAQDFTAPARDDAQPTIGPQYASITGVVRNATTLAAIGGARVQIGEFHTFTAADGTFSLTGRCDNVVNVTVSREGYQTYDIVEKFAPGTNTRGIRLTPIAAPNAI